MKETLMSRRDPSSSNEPKLSTAAEVGFRERLENYYARSANDKLRNFPKYMPRQQ